MQVNIQITGSETPEKLRALSAMLSAIADSNEPIDETKPIINKPTEPAVLDVPTPHGGGGGPGTKSLTVKKTSSVGFSGGGPGTKSPEYKKPDDYVTVGPGGGGGSDYEDSAPTVDKHGVPHDPQYCVNANAKEPFYQSGRKTGQWKARRGVSEADYDNWYSSQLENADDEYQQWYCAAREEPAPRGPGEFFGWIAKQQTAGILTQPMIDQAWATAGVTKQGIFNSETGAAAIAKIYGVLNDAINSQGE